MGQDDEDPAADWAAEDAETVVTDLEAIPELIPDGLADPVTPQVERSGREVTAPHRVAELAGYQVGFRAGAANAEGEYRRGVLTGRQEVLDALRFAYRSLDIADDLPAHLEAWVRSRLPPA